MPKLNDSMQELTEDQRQRKRKKDHLTNTTSSSDKTTSNSSSTNVFFIDPKRATTSMAESLEELRSSLLCPICNNLMKDPTTLSCTHSFCMECISNQKAWTCVMPGCNMPVTLRGKKSYIVNPQLSSVVSSLEVIQKTINSARPEWWKCSSYSQTMMSQHFGGSPHLASNSGDAATGEESSCDEGENDKVVSFNFEINTERYHDDDDNNDNCEDSDATTLGNGQDEDSFLSPILKRRKKSNNHGPAQIEHQGVDNDQRSDEYERKSSKDPTLDSDISSGIDPAGTVVPSSTPSSLQHRNHEKNAKDANKKEKENSETSDSPKIIENEMFLDNHTPSIDDNLNKSCSLPDISFHASPIAKESSQVGSSQQQIHVQSPLMKKIIDIVKETSIGETECSSFIDGTIKECNTDENNIESIRHESTSTTLFNTDNMEDDVKLGSNDIPNSKSITVRESKDIQKESDAAQSTKQPTSPIPMVFLLSPSSTLTLADQRILKKLIKKERLEMLHPPSTHDDDLDFCFDFDSDHHDHHVDCFLQSLYTRDNTSHYPVEYSYAICSNAEYQMFEGYIMPRSFRYILAVACGLSIIDFSYLRQAANQSSFGTHYLYAPGSTMKDNNAAEIASFSRRKRSRGKDGDEGEVNYQIAGDVDSLEMMGPQRSREMMLQKLGQLDHDDFWCYNNGLLDGYHVILNGDYDDPVTLTSSLGDGNDKLSGGKKGRKQEAKTLSAIVATDNQYTKGRVRMLLKLCGANVCDETRTIVSFTTGSKILILTKDGAKHKECVKSVLDTGYRPKELVESAPIVGLRWLQDTIAEFKVKNIHEYAN
eukprot:CAMPEP_0176490512 /NCGR_PEP_ID=MMETSP0200_2-20121128/7912_1 /TAXON_ID=947934 /ORGANISM="Chaetoceros sp., Strain GSL56" /LENGTH=820 /DNA_ID=CAMNT_0017887827 /DNA_START=40 /DNA_END=2502 /DNA_ORIENTATION=-